MANKTITYTEESGLTIWFAVFNRTGQVWDFTAGSFKALGSAANFSTAMSAVAGAAYAYQATLDLATLNATALPVGYTLKVYDQAGGSPSLSADTVVATENFVVQLSAEPLSVPLVEPNADGVIDGSGVELMVWLESDGVVVDLDTFDASATCDVTIREHGAGAVLLQVDDADNVAFALSANVPNKFELTKSAVITAGLDDSSCFMRVSIVENGNTWVKDFPAPVFGGS